MSLWNPKKALNQPPHFGRVGHQAVERTSDPKILAAQKAIHAIRDGQFDRPRMGRSNGTRPGLI